MRRKCKAQSGQAGYVNAVTHEALSSSADRSERRLIRKSESSTSIGRPCFGFASLLNWTDYSTSGALVTQFGGLEYMCCTQPPRSKRTTTSSANATFANTEVQIRYRVARREEIEQSLVPVVVRLSQPKARNMLFSH
ncbi:uncharacterized protein PpBr36_11378 [Pyricularia pennisetigena]|uniref:uncharacterized protein n=1 Tax=Pyricularia pennisetigena TaxID=1578925 RepID=UPI0011529602|nr:uncharacterized protein PpBr36_11378 [Pyricularia pennisetigena]TLS20428.1 hypothetical protein PpBr36_11378 [Pyricularia pennisetigena]